jgi:hypothetical protein
MSLQKRPTDRDYQEYLSNRPAVLLSKDRGVERIGKGMLKEAFQVYIQELNESELTDEVSKLI